MNFSSAITQWKDWIYHPSLKHLHNQPKYMEQEVWDIEQQADQGIDPLEKVGEWGEPHECPAPRDRRGDPQCGPTISLSEGTEFKFVE